MITGFVSPSDPMQAGRLRKALAKQYRFSDGVICSLGARILTRHLIRRSHYIRHYARKKRQGEYKRLSNPAHEYTVWHQEQADGPELGLSVPKIVFDALPHLATKTTEQSIWETPIRPSGTLRHLRPGF